MTEVPLSKAPNPQLLPGRWSNGCPLLRVRVQRVRVRVRVCVCVCSLLTAVCVHSDGLNAEDQFRSCMGHHTWQYITLLLYKHATFESVQYYFGLDTV